MKSLLFKVVATIVQHDYELKQFYEKKLEQGKPKLWVFNAIKNKVLARIFAVIKRRTEYKAVDNYQKWKAAA
ncbi:MAG: IS110 family transposase, partial [Bacteroidia bacterium]